MIMIMPNRDISLMVSPIIHSRNTSPIKEMGMPMATQKENAGVQKEAQDQYDQQKPSQAAGAQGSQPFVKFVYIADIGLECYFAAVAFLKNGEHVIYDLRDGHDVLVVSVHDLQAYGILAVGPGVYGVFGPAAADIAYVLKLENPS